MRNNSFFKTILLAITVVFFISCDKDFNTIGGDLIGNEHFGLESKAFDVIAYNQKIGPVASNNLPVNALGIYDDPAFGTTEANFVTQVTLAAVNPTIDLTLNQEVESVILSIPYFIRSKTTDATNGNSVYVLDSIYGDPNGKIKLSIYENGYFMRDFDPLTGFSERQKFYTNQGSDFEGLKASPRLNDSVALSQNEQFVFDAKEFNDSLVVNGVKSLVHTPPEMRLFLNKGYFKTRIIAAAASGKLLNNDVFKEYFRGLYFKVEKSGSKSTLGMMNFAKGIITINYKENKTIDSQEKVNKSIVLNLIGNTASLLTHTNKTEYTNATSVVDTVAGDSKLYLKGGEGALSIINLFNKTDLIGYDANGNKTSVANGVPDDLDDLRNPADKKSMLINEANLVFHIDQATMGSSLLPKRIYLYDFTNNTSMLDYRIESVNNTATSGKNGLLIYSGFLNTTIATDNTYKIRITNHIRNLIADKTVKNIKLGIVVTEDITNPLMNLLKLPLQANTTLTTVPQASVMNPLGVILYGSKADVPENKRLKLEIYYTKPN